MQKFYYSLTIWKWPVEIGTRWSAHATLVEQSLGFVKFTWCSRNWFWESPSHWWKHLQNTATRLLWRGCTLRDRPATPSATAGMEWGSLYRPLFVDSLSFCLFSLWIHVNVGGHSPTSEGQGPCTSWREGPYINVSYIRRTRALYIVKGRAIY